MGRQRKKAPPTNEMPQVEESVKTVSVPAITEAAVVPAYQVVYI
jgi:hypothetical protein